MTKISIDVLIDLLEQKQVIEEHFLDDVIETNNSLELFDEKLKEYEDLINQVSSEVNKKN